MIIVIRWHFNQRDQARPIHPEMSGVFGPFVDRESAKKWLETQPNWDAWGEYEYQIEDLISIAN